MAWQPDHTVHLGWLWSFPPEFRPLSHLVRHAESPDTQALGWQCDVLVSDETQRLRDPTTNSAAAPSGGLNALPSKPSALERCQHNVAELQRVLHIARLSLICFSSADSFMFVIKQRMLDVTLRKTGLSCWNSRRFHCLTNTTPHLQSLAAEGPVLPNESKKSDDSVYPQWVIIFWTFHYCMTQLSMFSSR